MGHLMIGLISLVCMAAGTNDLRDQARQFLEHCQRGTFDKAAANFDATMGKALPTPKLGEVWNGLIKQLGPIQSMGPARVDTVKKSTRVKIRCEFKTMPLDALVSFNPDGQIEGFFMVPAAKPADAADPPYIDSSKFEEEPITVGADGWPLPGILTRPRAARPVPLVILVHGSGPQDKDETIGPNTPFRELARGLATRGIAVIRYDKRTHAHKDRLVQGNKAATITLDEEVIDDVLATLVKARGLSGIDSSRIFVLGHSLGGAVAPVIAQRDKQLAGIILMAASNRSPEQLLRDQLTYIKSVDPEQAEATDKLLKNVEAGFARLKAGKAKDDEMIMGASVRYWKSWQGVESARIAGSLKQLPILVLQGGRDYQVTQVDFDAFRTALRGRPNTAFHLYPDLNHLFHKGGGKAVPKEYLKPGQVDQRVIEEVARWIRSLK